MLAILVIVLRRNCRSHFQLKLAAKQRSSLHIDSFLFPRNGYNESKFVEVYWQFEYWPCDSKDSTTKWDCVRCNCCFPWLHTRTSSDDWSRWLHILGTWKEAARVHLGSTQFYLSPAIANQIHRTLESLGKYDMEVGWSFHLWRRFHGINLARSARGNDLSSAFQTGQKSWGRRRFAIQSMIMIARWST